MMDFLADLEQRNTVLFYFGLLNFSLAMLFFILSKAQYVEIAGANGWHKPLKFALSIGILAWTMAWYLHYIPSQVTVTTYNWVYVVMMSFEIIYIGWQALKGEQSHFNVSTPFHNIMYAGMAVAASVVTLFTAYIGILFFTQSYPELPDYYLWAIRLGIIIFAVFAFEGFLMGSQLQHTIGAPDGGEGIPFLNWSKTHGDARIAHFIGMHALQVIPIVSYYLLKNVKLTIGLALIYGALALYTLALSVQGKPLRLL
jgi:hypothetical protein